MSAGTLFKHGGFCEHRKSFPGPHRKPPGPVASAERPFSLREATVSAKKTSPKREAAATVETLLIRGAGLNNNENGGGSIEKKN